MSLDVDLEILKPYHLQFAVCFLSVVKDVISQFQALVACCHGFHAAIDSKPLEL